MESAKKEKKLVDKSWSLCHICQKPIIDNDFKGHLKSEHYVSGLSDDAYEVIFAKNSGANLFTPCPLCQPPRLIWKQNLPVHMKFFHGVSDEGETEASRQQEDTN